MNDRADHEERFANALASYQLFELMHELKAEGTEQDEMFALFDRHRAIHASDADQTTHDYICDMMDLIVGWCLPEHHVFDPSPPPPTLNGADVVLWINSRTPYCTVLRGMTRHAIRALAICHTHGTAELLLFRCYADWTVVDSLSHATPETAMVTARQWGVQLTDWKALADSP